MALLFELVLPSAENYLRLSKINFLKSPSSAETTFFIYLFTLSLSHKYFSTARCKLSLNTFMTDDFQKFNVLNLR